jgi:SPP1 Gp6-like portal protein
MILDPADVTQIATQIILLRNPEQARLKRISNYMRGKHDPPYAPRGVNSEYRWIMKKGKRNFLPLITSVISQNLHVDGFKPSNQTTVETASSIDTDVSWNAFRANRMISRQHGVHRSVIKYGAAYVVVLPGQMSTDEEQPQDVPVVRPVSPRRMTALYADDVDDEWPQIAVEVRVVTNAQNPGKKQLIVSLYDEQSRYILVSQPSVAVPEASVSLTMADPDEPNLGGQPPIATHGLDVCPVVRFLYEADLDGETDCAGEIEPIMPIQDQVNFSTFNLMMAEQFQAFRQRWITGMAPADESGREPAPFRPGVDRVWAAEDPGTKFGDFQETRLEPYIDVRESDIRHLSTITQVPPYHLLGQIANLSAEALAAARDGLDNKVKELQAILTDPWRNVRRLTGLAAGDKAVWNDTNAQVMWRDTSAKAFAATIDGLGKAAQMLGVPVEELWRRIPGVTADDVNSWLEARQQEQNEQMIQQALQAAVAVAAQQAPGASALPPGASPPPQPAALPVPTQPAGSLPTQPPPLPPQGTTA